MVRTPRLTTPAALLLGLVLFAFLPCVTASCQAPPEPGKGPVAVEVAYTGADLAMASTHVEVSGDLRMSAAEQRTVDATYAVAPAVRWSAIGTALVLLIAALVGLGGGPLRRGGAALASVAALVVTGTLSYDMVVGFAAELLLVSANLPGVDVETMQLRIGEVVDLGWGFWLPLVLAFAAMALEAAVLVSTRRTAGGGTLDP